MTKDELFMQRCLDLAVLGVGSVSPNPMVGAVLVHRDRIIGEGYHAQFGGPHAEVHAIDAACAKYAAEVIEESTLYVSLEPCSHQGKTPPCVDLIIQHKISRIVIATTDPYPAVQGRGIQKLKEAGLEVEVGVLGEEAQFINRRFFTRIQKQRPYIILKWAQTRNNYFAPLSGRRWISGPEAEILNHRWRTEEDAILVGKNTVLIDDPKLTPRQWVGKSPIRLVLDRRLEIPDNYKVFDQQQETIVFTEKDRDSRDKIRYVSLESFDFYLAETLAYQCYLFDIQSIIIEGGKQTLDLFLQAGIVDEIRVFRSPNVWESGIQAPIINQSPDGSIPVGSDSLDTYYM